jgi:hypothetical protein
MNVISLAAESSTILPDEAAKRIKDVGYKLRELGDWYGWIGDAQAFNEKGEDAFSFSEAFREELQTGSERNTWHVSIGPGFA